MSLKKLENDVKRICKRHIKEYDNEQAFIDDLMQGCQSGIIGELIYYHDTLKFYKKHKKAINELLAEILNDCGYSSPSELFSKWDKTDPLAMETNNQNLLAWFAFEEMASRLFL